MCRGVSNGRSLIEYKYVERVKPASPKKISDAIFVNGSIIFTENSNTSHKIIMIREKARAAAKLEPSK